MPKTNLIRKRQKKPTPSQSSEEDDESFSSLSAPASPFSVASSFSNSNDDGIDEDHSSDSDYSDPEVVPVRKSLRTRRATIKREQMKSATLKAKPKSSNKNRKKNGTGKTKQKKRNDSDDSSFSDIKSSSDSSRNYDGSDDSKQDYEKIKSPRKIGIGETAKLSSRREVPVNYADNDVDEEDEENIEEGYNSQPKKRRKNTTKNEKESDEEFIPDEDEDDDDDENNVAEESSDDSLILSTARRKRRSQARAKSQHHYNEEEDDDDFNIGDKLSDESFASVSSCKKGRKAFAARKRRRHRNKKATDASSVSSSDSSNNDGTNEKVGNDEMSFCDEASDTRYDDNGIADSPIQYPPFRTTKTTTTIQHHLLSEPMIEPLPPTPIIIERQIPTCTSTHDPITMERLRPLHVCTVAPDGKSKHCFALNTLYRASIMKGTARRYKKDGTSIAFLQPPHFRTIIDEHLEDQIATRFGRRALVIEESDVYKQQEKHTKAEAMVEALVEGENVNSLEGFRDALNRYISSAMGTGDLYTCPVCYTETLRRMNSDGEESDGEGSNDDSGQNGEYTFEKLAASHHDPMSVLGYLDDDQFIVASSFCFRKITQLKAHLKDVHKFDTSTVEGNDLYKRFMIRAQDGLLQSHLKSVWGKHVVVGAMQKYWFQEGHNQSFVLLRSLVDKVQVMKTSGEDVDQTFCTSFEQRSKNMWMSIMSPYERENSDFIGEFINNSEEEEGQFERINPYFEKNDDDIETQFAQCLKDERKNRERKYKDRAERSSSDSSNGEESSYKDDSISVQDNNVDDDGDSNSNDGDIIESEEDEWMKSKRKPMRRELKKKTKTLISGKRRLGLMSQKSAIEDDDQDECLSENSYERHNGSKIFGSDDEESDKDSDSSFSFDSSDDDDHKQRKSLVKTKKSISHRAISTARKRRLLEDSDDD